MSRIDNDKVIHAELSYRLNGIFFCVHNKLGRFLKERQYADAIETRLQETGMGYKREKKIQAGDINFGLPDFVIEDKIVVELKAKKFVTKEDYYQLLIYLKSKNFKLGLIVNFRNTYLRPKRIVN